MFTPLCSILDNSYIFHATARKCGKRWSEFRRQSWDNHETLAALSRRLTYEESSKFSLVAIVSPRISWGGQIMQRPYGRRYLRPNNMHEASHGDFEYVVIKKEQPYICFGTGLAREVLPTDGPCMSPFMRLLTQKGRPNLGPGVYNGDRDAFYDLTHRIYSKYGLGPKSPRFASRHEYQPPPRELPPIKPIPQNCAAFNQTGQRKGIFKANPYPASCDYCPEFRKRQIKFSYSFSGKKVLRCPVMIKCVPYNLDACGYCGCSCSAQGDYWQFENRIFLCRDHYSQLFKHCLSKFQGAKLSDFKSVRDCFFAHAHNSCQAALKIMTNEEIQKKLRKEAYLDLYFPQRRFCDGAHD